MQLTKTEYHSNALKNIKYDNLNTSDGTNKRDTATRPSTTGNERARNPSSFKIRKAESLK